MQRCKKLLANINDVCRFSSDYVVECSERTVLSCLNQFAYVGNVSEILHPSSGKE